MTDKVALQVHHIRFFEHQPLTINCIAYDEESHRIAISRSDASIQLYSTRHNWTLEQVFPGSADASVEALLWAQGRLFAAGLGGNVVELDLETQMVKDSVSSNAGPIWCLTKDPDETYLAAGTEDGCVVLFGVEENLHFLRGFGKQDDRILSITWFHRDHENFIITGGINNIRQWSVKSGQPVSRMTLGRQVNKDTIVWCVAVTKDFTIISGDSRGVVTFWNGKESTQMKTFHCHKADVLSICLSQDETTAFSGGVDAAIFQFSLYSTDPYTQRKRWVHQLLHAQHTHDIRALAYVNESLASGGVDTVLKVARLKEMKSVSSVAPFPPVGLVHIAKDKNLVLLQYPTYIEVWRLGDAQLPDVDEKVQGILPLSLKPIKLLQLKARDGQEIIASTISPQGMMAFSDSKSVRLYQLVLEKEESSMPAVNLNRIRFNFHGAARLMTFTPDGENLIAVLMMGIVEIMNTKTGEIRHSLKQESPVHLLSVDPNSRLFALASVDHKVNVYHVDSATLECSCPVQSCQVSAMNFSPHSPVLALAYSDHSIYEMDMENREYTSWCREHSSKFKKNWLKPLRRISNIIFHPNHSDWITVFTDNCLAVLDKSQVAKKEKAHTSSNSLVESARKCFKYKYLLFADFLPNGMLVAVERPPSMIDDQLPPSLKQKKFGIS